MPEVQIIQQKNSIQIVQSTNGNKFQLEFNQVNYQISGVVLKRTTNISNQQQIYQLSTYEPAEQCRLIGTSLSNQQLDVVNLGFIVTKYFVSRKKKRVYLLGDSNLIHIFNYDENGFVPSESIQFNQYQSSQSIFGYFVQVGDSVLFSTKDILYKLPQKPQDSIKRISDMKEKLYPDGKNILIYKFKPTKNQNQFIIFSQKGVIITKVSSNQLQKINFYEPQPGKIFMDGTYDPKYDTYYLLQQNILIIQKQGWKNAFELQGKACSKLKLIGTSLFVVCNENRVNFIAQFLVNNIDSKPDLILNRYYNNVQGVSDVYSAGHDKQVLTSGDQLAFMGLSIHKSVLKQINKRQPMQSFLTQPLIGITHVQECDMDKKSTLIIVTVDKIQLVSLKTSYPKIQCAFRDNHPKILTTVFNTSHCTDGYVVSSNGKRDTENLRAICTQWYPYGIAVLQSQMDSKVAILITVIAIVLAIGLTLFCVGFGFKRIQLTRVAMIQLQKKLKKLKERKKQMKPI